MSQAFFRKSAADSLIVLLSVFAAETEGGEQLTSHTFLESRRSAKAKQSRMYNMRFALRKDNRRKAVTKELLD